MRFGVTAVLVALAMGCTSDVTLGSRCPDADCTDPIPPIPGFTDFSPSEDSQIIYVSASMGDDANDGLSATTAVRTVARGVSLLRDGYPDWLLFRRGDRWDEAWENWTLSGRSTSEKMVISAYGQGPRPVFETSLSGGLMFYPGVDIPESAGHLAFVSLEFIASGRVAGQGNEAVGFDWLQDGEDLHLEDCRFANYATSLRLQPDSGSIRDVRISRSIFHANWRPGISSVNVFIWGGDNVSISESVFDTSGWNPNIAEAIPGVDGAAVELRDSPGAVRLTDSIIVNAAATGVHVTTDAELRGNLFVANPISIVAGAGDGAPAITVAIAENVILHGNDILPRGGHAGDEPRGWAIDLGDIAASVVTNNVIANCDGGDCSTVAMHPGASLSANQVASWPARDSNELPSDVVAYVDSQRTIPSFQATLGGEGSIEGFAQAVRSQHKLAWDDRYTAAEINRYFFDGYTPVP